MRNKQINGFKFYRQYSVGSYILDFYCFKAKLAIELDGSQHNEFKQYKKDQKRISKEARYKGITILE